MRIIIIFLVINGFVQLHDCEKVTTCFQCTEAKSEMECQLTGSLQACPSIDMQAILYPKEEVVCETLLKIDNDGQKNINKSCNNKTLCQNSTETSEGFCDLNKSTKPGYECYSCCSKNLCNMYPPNSGITEDHQNVKLAAIAEAGPPRASTCNGQETFTIKCPSDEQIVITSAFYGYIFHERDQRCHYSSTAQGQNDFPLYITYLHWFTCLRKNTCTLGLDWDGFDKVVFPMDKYRGNSYFQVFFHCIANSSAERSDFDLQVLPLIPNYDSENNIWKSSCLTSSPIAINLDCPSYQVLQIKHFIYGKVKSKGSTRCSLSTYNNMQDILVDLSTTVQYACNNMDSCVIPLDWSKISEVFHTSYMGNIYIDAVYSCIEKSVITTVSGKQNKEKEQTTSSNYQTTSSYEDATAINMDPQIDCKGKNCDASINPMNGKKDGSNKGQIAGATVTGIVFIGFLWALSIYVVYKWRKNKERLTKIQLKKEIKVHGYDNTLYSSQDSCGIDSTICGTLSSMSNSTLLDYDNSSRLVDPTPIYNNNTAFLKTTEPSQINNSFNVQHSPQGESGRYVGLSTDTINSSTSIPYTSISAIQSHMNEAPISTYMNIEDTDVANVVEKNCASNMNTTYEINNTQFQLEGEYAVVVPDKDISNQQLENSSVIINTSPPSLPPRDVLKTTNSVENE